MNRPLSRPGLQSAWLIVVFNGVHVHRTGVQTAADRKPGWLSGLFTYVKDVGYSFAMLVLYCSLCCCCRKEPEWLSGTVNIITHAQTTSGQR